MEQSFFLVLYRAPQNYSSSEAEFARTFDEFRREHCASSFSSREVQSSALLGLFAVITDSRESAELLPATFQNFQRNETIAELSAARVAQLATANAS